MEDEARVCRQQTLHGLAGRSPRFQPCVSKQSTLANPRDTHTTMGGTPSLFEPEVTRTISRRRFPKIYSALSDGFASARGNQARINR